MIPMWDQENAGLYKNLLSNEDFEINLRVIPGQPLIEYREHKTGNRVVHELWGFESAEQIWKAFYSAFQIKEDVKEILKIVKGEK